MSKICPFPQAATVCKTKQLHQISWQTEKPLLKASKTANLTGIIGPLIRYKLCISYAFFDYFFQRSFFTENHFLITAINLTTRGPLYTCLVFQREFDAKEFVGWLESQDIYPLLVYHFGSRNFCYFWQKTLQNGKKQFQIILLQNLLTSSVLKKCTFKTSPMLVVYSEANGKDKII